MPNHFHCWNLCGKSFSLINCTHRTLFTNFHISVPFLPWTENKHGEVYGTNISTPPLDGPRFLQFMMGHRVRPRIWPIIKMMEDAREMVHPPQACSSGRFNGIGLCPPSAPRNCTLASPVHQQLPEFTHTLPSITLHAILMYLHPCCLFSAPNLFQHQKALSNDVNPQHEAASTRVQL